MYGGVRDFLQNAYLHVCVCVSVYYTRPCVHKRRGGYTRAPTGSGRGGHETKRKKKNFSHLFHRSPSLMGHLKL